MLGAGAAGFGFFITALGFGVAAGVIGVSVVQNRLAEGAGVHPVAGRRPGLSLIAAAASSSADPRPGRWSSCSASVPAPSTSSGSRCCTRTSRTSCGAAIFSALYTLVRLCLLIAFAIGPFLSELLNGLSTRLFDDRRVEIVGVDVYLPGVRLTLWLAGIILVLARRGRSPGRRCGPASVGSTPGRTPPHPTSRG